MMNRVTDVVRHLLIINVLVYFASLLLGEPTYGLAANEPDFNLGRAILGMFYPASPFFRPFQIVTHMFMHADIGHLFFNMIGLFFFGPALEAFWGPRKFLFYYLFTGFGALILHLIVQYISITYFGETPGLVWGASGCVFGLLAAYGMLFPDNIVSLIFPPISLPAKYFVLIFAGVELYLGTSGLNTGIAHFAHLGGALFGVLLIWYWRKFGSRL